MTRFLKQVICSEKGQALPIVLALMVLGGLTIAPALDYAATILNSSRTIKENVSGFYAADAAVEDALWCLGNDTTPPQQLPENINQMEAGLQTEDKGIYTLYFGELIQAGVHSDYLSVAGEMAWDEEAYKYTITVTWQPESGTPAIHLEEVGARLPAGYSYQPGSAASFAGNLSINEPDEFVDEFGAYMLTWELEPPLPSVSEGTPVQTQTFYTTGEGSLGDDYAWVVASSSDIGSVSEITGALYRITATATRPEDGATTAKIIADAIVEPEATHIVSWQIIK
ncbi:hypothetical protein ACFLV3_05225 [Chloroflexota bacterium]